MDRDFGRRRSRDAFRVGGLPSIAGAGGVVEECARKQSVLCGAEALLMHDAQRVLRPLISLVLVDIERVGVKQSSSVRVLSALKSRDSAIQALLLESVWTDLLRYQHGSEKCHMRAPHTACAA